MNIEAEFKWTAEKIYSDAKKQGRLHEGYSLEQLRDLALKQEGVIETKMGSIAADSEPTSRAAPLTKNSIDDQFGEEERRLTHQTVDILSSEDVISLDVIIGDGKDGVTTRFLMPEKHAQLAYGLKLLFDKPTPRIVEKPTYTIIFFSDEEFERNKEKRLIEKDVQICLAMGEVRGDQIKICRNSTYTGEGKKGVFTFEDWRIKTIDKTGLFLHAGARRDYLRAYDPASKKENLTEIITSISGLTATGKTTTSCRGLARLPGEYSEVIGDDGGQFGFDGSYAAFELNGMFIKTEGLDEDQPEILRAATSRDAFLENVFLKDGVPDFLNLSKTANGRAVITRENLGLASPGLRADKINYIILLTRNALVNGISKLTPEQATMQLIYGESIETSGGNPEEAGKFKRVFFLDPFVAGDRLLHAMIFYEFMKKNPDIQCYLANTGTIGQDEREINLQQSLATYDDLLRNRLVFSQETDHLGYHFPIACNRADLNLLVARPLFPDARLLESKLKDFLSGREEYLETFEGKYGKIPSHIRESLPYH